MAYNHENIIVGAADVYITPGALVEDLPALTAGTSARGVLNSDAAWDHAGLTSGGVELVYAPDFGQVDVDQYLDAAKMFKQGQTVTVNTTFAEATLKRLLFAWGQNQEATFTGEGSEGWTAGQDEELRISGGSLGAAPEERSFAFIGPAPGATASVRKERVYFLGRVLNVESVTTGVSKTEASMIPVGLRALPMGGQDTSGEVEYGYILDRTITT